MNKKCTVCNKEFRVKQAEYDRRKTCSKECFKKHKTDKIKCKCYICNKEILKTKSQINKSKSGYVFCSNTCVGKYNGEVRKQNIKKNCIICNKQFNTIKARENTHITCSNKCQGEWQTRYRVGENSSNYRGGGKIKECIYCHNDFKTKTPYEYENRKFCSVDCKVKHWKKYTLHNEKFKISHYKGNLRYRQESKETRPERLIREYLEDKGLIRDVDFFQEKGFFRKYYADFFIPKNKTIIEVNGDFWHGNPKIYGEGLKPLYPSQIERIGLDKIKEEDFIRYGFNYHVIWESDINDNIDKSMENIKIQ